MKIINNEAVFPLQLEANEYVASRSFDENWEEYIVFRISGIISRDNDNLTCEILARDKLHKVDHKKEIKEMVLNYEITGIWTTYTMDNLLNRKVVFQLDIKDLFSGELSQLTVLNQLPMSSYKCFNRAVLYCKDRR